MFFFVAFGQMLDDEGELARGHGISGGLGLIVLTQNGANLGVVATNSLYEWFQTYNRPPNHNAIAIQRLGPNGGIWLDSQVGRKSVAGNIDGLKCMV